jgi:hypothetical protein
MSNAPKVAPEVIVAAVEEHPTWSNVRLGKSLGISEASVRRGLDSVSYKRHLIPSDLGFEDRFEIILDRPLTHTGDVMITADWHIPLYDPAYVNQMILTARANGIRDLILAGDFFNFDSLSAYDPKQHSAGLDIELREAASVMRVLLESFDTIYYLWGNHDVRMHRALGFAIEFREAMRMVFGILGNEALERIKFTNLDHMWIDAGEGETGEFPWYVCHPKAYNERPADRSHPAFIEDELERDHGALASLRRGARHGREEGRGRDRWPVRQGPRPRTSSGRRVSPPGSRATHT